MKVPYLTLAFILLSVPLIVTTSVSEGYGIMHVSGPSIVATNDTAHYTVTINGEFDVYKCTLLMGGENLSNAEPLGEVKKMNYNGVFKFDIHTPIIPQRIYLNFKGIGIINSTNTTKIFEKKLIVEVKTPFMINVKVRDIENYDIRNVTVRFYIDGNYIGSTVINKILANSTKNVGYKWVPSISEGAHQLKVEIDSKGIVFENGKNYYVREIYYGNPPSYDWVLYSGIGAIVALSTLLVFIMMGKKGRKQQAKPKWKS